MDVGILWTWLWFQAHPLLAVWLWANTVYCPNSVVLSAWGIMSALPSREGQWMQWLRLCTTLTFNRLPLRSSLCCLSSCVLWWVFWPLVSSFKKWEEINNIYFIGFLSFPGGSVVKNLLMQETWVQSLGQKDPLKKEMATCFNILAWEIPWMEESGGARVHGDAKSQT